MIIAPKTARPASLPKVPFMAFDAENPVPLVTYRFQFTADFGFQAAADLVPYLAKLGVSHLYASPYLKARPGSTHGYDIVDHNAINPELGGIDGFERLIAALRQHGIKQILDFVPNHMGVGGSDNAWWLDVLENGPASRFSSYFDIDWHVAGEHLPGRDPQKGEAGAIRRPGRDHFIRIAAGDADRIA